MEDKYQNAKGINLCRRALCSIQNQSSVAIAAMLLVFVYDHVRKTLRGLYVFSAARGSDSVQGDEEKL